MREKLFGNWRVPVTTLFALALVVGAYFLTRGVTSPPAVQASTESALLKAIATKDTDGDGLPDWQEALYGTSPTIVDTLKLGMTDGEAVARGLIVPLAIADVPSAPPSSAAAGKDGLPSAPGEGTLTAAFAKVFFTLFVKAREVSGDGELSESVMQQIADEALNSLGAAANTAPAFKSAKDITVKGTGPDALKDFAARAEAVLMRRTSNATKSELLYLGDAIERNDAAAVPFISSIANAYRESAVGLAILHVPAELAGEHLALVNAMMRMSQVTAEFARVHDDPLATMLALKQYPSAVLDLGNAFIRIGAVYRTAGISLPADAPGAAFVNLIQNAADKQAAEKKAAAKNP